MKKLKLLATALALTLPFSIGVHAANIDPAATTNEPLTGSVPRPLILQDFENCDTGNLDANLRQRDDSDTQYRVGELAPTSQYKSAKVAEKTGATTIEDWDPASFGSKALELTMSPNAEAQLAYIEWLPGQYDWSKFAKDFNGDDKIDGYFGFFINASEFADEPLKLEINFTMTNNDVWWMAGWANETDTDKVMTTAFGGSKGMQLDTYSEFPVAGFPIATNGKSYVMVRLDKENFRGLSNPGAPEDNGGRIDFSAIKSVTIRITGASALEDKKVYIDNFFVGVNPFMKANSGGNFGNSGLTVNGSPLIELKRDLAAPVMTFDPEFGNELGEATLKQGEKFVLPIPTITDDVYKDDFAAENKFSITVEDPNGELLELGDEEEKSFTVDADPEACYIITYTAVDGAGNTSKKEVQAIVKAEETQVPGGNEGGNEDNTPTESNNGSEDEKDETDGKDEETTGSPNTGLAGLSIGSVIALCGAAAYLSRKKKIK